MTTRRFAILSILLSLALHFVFFRATEKLALSGTLAEIYSPRDLAPQEDVYIPFRLDTLPPPSPPADAPKATQGDAPPVEAPDALLAPGAPGSLPAPPTPTTIPLDVPDGAEGVAELLKQAEFFEQPEDRYVIAGIEGAKAQPLVSTVPETALQPVTAPRPEILEIPLSALPPARQNLPGRMLRPQLERVAVPADIQLPSLAAPGELSSMPAAGETRSLQLKAGGRPTFGIPDIHLPAPPIPGATLASHPAGESLPSLDPNSGALPAVNSSGVPMPQAIDPFVQVNVTIRRDDHGTGGYFQVDIRPNRDSDAVPDIPKDLLFIIDRSGSIPRGKYHQFRESVKEALATLSPNDRFNVIAFNDSPRAVFPRLTPGTPENIRIANDRISRFEHGGMTDVFGGLAPFVQHSNGNLSRPLNIFLLTDGQSTVNMHRPNEFLRQIVDLNPGNVSIFPCSAGDKANRQLLDFLGYLNRGAKCHVSGKQPIQPALVSFIARHSHLIVMNLSCRAIKGATPREIYPRSLPHLYRSEALTLFGRFEDINSELALRITGNDAQGKKLELVFLRRLNECPVGDTHLPQRWAGQKILFLLSRLNSTDNPAEARSLNAQITDLTRRFKIYSAY